MYIVKQMPAFEQWFGDLKDGMTRIRLGKRLDKVQRGDVLIVMLGGGNKSTQSADIQHAMALAKSLEE
jgi:putative component of toxin-antitoxin plasmid stabilization module